MRLAPNVTHTNLMPRACLQGPESPPKKKLFLSFFLLQIFLCLLFECFYLNLKVSGTTITHAEGPAAARISC